MSRTITEMGLREHARTPLLLGLLLGLPTYLIALFARVVPGRPVPVDVPGQGLTRLSLDAVLPVLMTPMTAALIGGVAGLFVLTAAREADRRLVVAGVSPVSIVGSRLALLAVASLLAATVAVTALLTTHTPGRPVWLAAATGMVGLTYGSLGAVVGLAVSRLGGVYLMLFGPFLDIFLAQSPLSVETSAIAPYLPGHHAVNLAVDAAFTPDVTATAAGGAVAYLAVAAGLAATAVVWSVR